jgi:ADP-ribose pyrophosphatase
MHRAATIIKHLMKPRFLHTKARVLEYQGGTKRTEVPDDKVDWNVEFPDYKPVDYTAPVVLSKPVWADPDFRSEKDLKPQYNAVDGKVDRRSFEGAYQIENNVPKNPFGRTGKEITPKIIIGDYLRFFWNFKI